MLFVCASEIARSELAQLGNNIRLHRRRTCRHLDERSNRRVLSAVNRSLASYQERVDRLHHGGRKFRNTVPS